MENKNSVLDTTILLPCFNEEKALSLVIEDIRTTMQASIYNYEILVVDDCSTDKSAEVAERLGCRVIRHKLNRGAGASRKTGIIAAKGKYIVMLDADATYSAKYIPNMINLLSEYDQVNGARTSEKGTMRFLRQPAKWFIRKLASFLAGYKIPDLNTGLKAFRRQIMLPYLWCIPDGFSCVSSMTLAFFCNGHSVAYIPIEYKKRIGKSKFRPLKDTFEYLLTVFRLIVYFKPLQIFVPVSLFLLVLGIGKSFYDYFFLIKRLQLSDLVLIITGVLIGLQGLLADLIVAQARSRFLNIQIPEK